MQNHITRGGPAKPSHYQNHPQAQPARLEDPRAMPPALLGAAFASQNRKWEVRMADGVLYAKDTSQPKAWTWLASRVAHQREGRQYLVAQLGQAVEGLVADGKGHEVVQGHLSKEAGKLAQQLEDRYLYRSVATIEDLWVVSAVGRAADKLKQYGVDPAQSVALLRKICADAAAVGIYPFPAHAGFKPGTNIGQFDALIKDVITRHLEQAAEAAEEMEQSEPEEEDFPAAVPQPPVASPRMDVAAAGRGAYVAFPPGRGAAHAQAGGAPSHAGRAPAQRVAFHSTASAGRGATGAGGAGRARTDGKQNTPAWGAHGGTHGGSSSASSSSSSSSSSASLPLVTATRTPAPTGSAQTVAPRQGFGRGHPPHAGRGDHRGRPMGTGTTQPVGRGLPQRPVQHQASAQAGSPPAGATEGDGSDGE